MYESLSHVCSCFARTGVIEGDWKSRIREDYERRGGKDGRRFGRKDSFSLRDVLRTMRGGSFIL